jgi:hypothetical protein
MGRRRGGRRPFADGADGATKVGFDERRGACLGLDDFDLFFPGRNDRATTAAAKAVCANCIVKGPCLEAVLNGPDGPGVRGGLSEEEREQVRKQRQVAQRVLDAIAELVERERACNQPPTRDPGAWERKVRARLTSQYAELLEELAAADRHLSPAELADRLAPTAETVAEGASGG